MKRRKRQPTPKRLKILPCPVKAADGARCIWTREEGETACRTHWLQLPKELRLRIMRANGDPVTKASLEREAMLILERLAGTPA